MGRDITWTSFAWQILGALDRGRTLSPAETYAHIEDGTLLAWLQSELGDDYTPYYVEDVPGAADQLLEEFQSLANAVDTRRKFGVEENGLCILLAFTIEMAQQAINR